MRIISSPHYFDGSAKERGEASRIRFAAGRNAAFAATPSKGPGAKTVNTQGQPTVSTNSGARWIVTKVR